MGRKPHQLFRLMLLQIRKEIELPGLLNLLRGYV